MDLDEVGFEPHEIRTDEPTRAARLKWVVVVAESLPAGRQVNAAVCAAAATQARVSGLIGPDGIDADGVRHPGLPWVGCTVLGASDERMLTTLRRARSRESVFAAVMPALGQETRVYDEYLVELATLGEDLLAPLAISLVGPRRDVDKIVGGLPLLA